MRKSKFYVVKEGHIPGLYYDYIEAEEQIYGYSKAIWRSLKTLAEALAYQAEDEAASPQEPPLADAPRRTGSATRTDPTLLRWTEQDGDAWPSRHLTRIF